MPTPSLLIVPARFKTGKLYSQIPTSGAGDFTVTRATNATRVNASGLIESVASGIPRLDYFASGGTVGCPALLVEPAATNQIRNNSMSGAVTGTPGTLPTGGGWGNSLVGLTQTVIGTGAENGISYIDIRFSGTATSTDVVETRYESTTQINALSGQTWTHSVYLKKIAEPNPPSNYQLNIYERASAGGYLANGALTIVPTTTNLQRFSQTRTLSQPTTAKTQPGLFYSVVSGTAYNFTIRIGYPQMELGSVATSVIPTATGSVTRNADVISVSGAVSGAIGQTEGTLYWEGNTSNGLDDVIMLNRNATNSVVLYKDSNNRYLGRVYYNSLSFTFQTATNITGFVKIAIAYKQGSPGDSAMYMNGVRVQTTNTANWAFTAALNDVIISKSPFFAGAAPSHYRGWALYTTRLTNAQLAALTSP